MVRKDDLPKAENRKRKFGKESNERARKSVEKKREAVQEFAIMTTTTGTTPGSSPRYNECRYRHTGACWISPTAEKHVILLTDA